MTLLEGAVVLSNELGQVDMPSGYQGIVEPGKAPVKTPMLEAINIIQWCLYYPGVLDTSELALGAEDQKSLAASLSSYRSGDLISAVSNSAPAASLASTSAIIYRAATLLSVGQAEQAEALLEGVQRDSAPDNRAHRLAKALLEVIAVVKNLTVTNLAQPELATEWLADSYFLQAHSRLPEALQAARFSVAKSPNFGFGWARVAELELSVGHLSESLKAVEKSLQISPRNAQSLSVKGFIELAQGHTAKASDSFERAIAADGALGNGWLGQGLCKIRRGQSAAGMQDIQTASILEPQRSVLRSYLAKSFSNNGDNKRASNEVLVAAKLDPNDPTSWLYRALIEQQENLINPALRDLENSQKLNDNRSLFRSRLLLDEDQAVRGANLARIYQDTGIYSWNKDQAASDWGVRQASRSVNYDYANYSAHQFLADSYDALRDPNQINLRYETPWFDELIMANLLSPVSAGNLSEYSSQRQASELFEQNHFGVISDTEYLSRGDWLQRSSQYGSDEKVAYAIDNEYRAQHGWRANNHDEQLTTSVKAKLQLAPEDSIFVEGIYYDSKFGDNGQYYNQYSAAGLSPSPSALFSGKEFQHPNVFTGYHHEWGPGIHTLFLGGYLNDHVRYDDPLANILFTANSFGVPVVSSQVFPVNYNRRFEAYSAELQQIFQTERQTMVGGFRYQNGRTTASSSELDNNFNNPPLEITQPGVRNNLEHYSVYGYESFKVLEPLQLTGGVTYDYLRFPRNDDIAPISGDETARRQISPKAGLVWTITPETLFRFAYTRSLGGLSYDNSVRLEPTQVAGFNQAFRSIIPESVVGIVPGSHFTTYGVGLERSFNTGTYINADGQLLDSDANRDVGVITNTPYIFPIPTSGTNVSQSLGYTEQTLAVGITQLLGDKVSGGARYQLSHAKLNSQLFNVLPYQDQSATLNQLTLHLNYILPCGFFSQFQSIWTAQSNHGYSPTLADADFWQFNAYAGYRFNHRRAEIKLGLLNLTDQNYLLNPLNLYYDLPRERTFAASFKFFF